jgi:hypothetical protein
VDGPARDDADALVTLTDRARIPVIHKRPQLRQVGGVGLIEPLGQVVADTVAHHFGEPQGLCDVGRPCDLPTAAGCPVVTDHLADEFVAPGRQAERAQLRAAPPLWDIDPSGWAPPVSFVTQRIDDVLDLAQRHAVHGPTAGLLLPFSSGAVEGQVNRIKMLKRQMFGRAGVDLLRKRVLLTR